MGRACSSGGMSHGWVRTVYVHIKLQLSKSKRRHPLGFGWKRARKNLSEQVEHVGMSHVCMTSWLWMEHCWNSGSCGSIGCCSLHSNLNSLSSGISTANHSRWLMLLCCYVISPQVSTDNFACWLVCNLQSLSSEFAAASLPLIRCNVVSFSSENKTLG